MAIFLEPSKNYIEMMGGTLWVTDWWTALSGFAGQAQLHGNQYKPKMKPHMCVQLKHDISF